MIDPVGHAAWMKAKMFSHPEARDLAERAAAIDIADDSQLGTGVLIIALALGDDEFALGGRMTLSRASEFITSRDDLKRRLIEALMTADMSLTAERAMLTPAEQSALRVKLVRESVDGWVDEGWAALERLKEER